MGPAENDERTPLLAEGSVLRDGYDASELTTAKLDHNLVYQRFNTRRKVIIVMLITWSGFISPFVSGSIMPVIPQIAEDLGTTGSLVSLTISVSVLASALGAIVGASYSTFYGRRPVYIVVLPLLCLGSFGVALSPSIGWMFLWRFIQALGSSPGMSVGAGVIGDLYQLEHRGTAMGIYIGGVLLGAAVAPFMTGVASGFYPWRVVQMAMGLSAALAYLLMLVLLPETSHPGTRGIDKWRVQHGAHVNFVWVNPLRSLELLKSPHLLLLSIAGTSTLLTDYVLVTPLAYTIAPAYGITNPGLIGLCFVPLGLGNFLGAPLAGWVSDKIVTRYRAKRGGIWYPEDRLRGTLLGAGFLVPASVLLSGLLTQFTASGKADWSLWCNMICLFCNGIGVDLVLSPSVAYGVDIMHSRSAESLAANSSLRNVILALGIATIHPLISHIGVAATNGISASLAWLGFGLLWCLIRYGDRMRAWSSIDYSTADTN